MRIKRSHAFLGVLLLLTGCASIIGVPDLTFEESADSGSLDSSADSQARTDATTDSPSGQNDAGSDVNQGGNDAGKDSATCDLSKTVNDPLNCGSCGHVCLDDAGCASSMCGATILTTLPGLELVELTESGDYLYATVDTFDTPTAQQGVYRIHKTTGAHTLYAKLANATKGIVIGDSLWITTYTSYNASFPEDNGGIYRCKLVAGDTCNVELVTPVSYPGGPNAIGSKLYYADYGRLEFRTLDTDGGFIADGGADAEAFITKYGATTEIGNLWEMWVDPASLPTTYFMDEYNDGTVVTYKLNPAGASQKSVGQYSGGSNDGQHGTVLGNANSLYWTASDYFPGLGGALKKVSRTNDVDSCDLGNRSAGKNEVLRPHALHLDAKNVYWTNKGEYGAGAPNGSVAMCPIDTCCPDAKFVWNGSGAPWALTGDATRLYWSIYTTGDIYKAQKP